MTFDIDMIKKCTNVTQRAFLRQDRSQVSHLHIPEKSFTLTFGADYLTILNKV